MRCALYFGSFNPLHIGHTAIAEYVLTTNAIDSFRFILSPHNPLKDADTLQDAQKRLEALNEAVKKLNKHNHTHSFAVSDVEFHLPSPLYTYHTLQYIRHKEPDTTFILIIGGDNLAIIEKWYCWREIFAQFEVWVYPRKGFNTAELCKKYGATYLDAPQIDISSTQIRTKELSGEDTSQYRY